MKIQGHAFRSEKVRWLGRRVMLFCQVILLCSLAVSTSQAQTSTGLEGTIMDQSGAVLPGAQITLTNEGTGAKRSTVTGVEGSYVFAQIPAGQYTLAAEAKGFKKAVSAHIAVLVATPARVDLTLQVGRAGETVNVEAGLMMINTQDASVGTPFVESEIKQLPFAARNPVDLLTFEPGVVVTGSSDSDLLAMGSTQQLDPREGVVNGVRGNQSNISLDGIEANDYQNQSAFTSAVPVTLDSLQEFRVITTNATAVSGGAGGAQVEMVTKSGTNKIHGNARWFNRNSAMAANSFFNNMNGVGKAQLVRNIFGASLGGPVKKDRLFLFMDYEGRIDHSAEPLARVVPSETLKQGILYYQLDPSAPGYNASAPGVIPCPVGGGTCRMLAPTDIAALDPGCTTIGSAGCGDNPAMLTMMQTLYPKGNSAAMGFDAGLNSTGYLFDAPVRTNNGIYTARMDIKLTSDGRHSMFVRGNLAAINTDIQPAEFPALAPSSRLQNNSRSLIVNYTGVLSPMLVNTAEWGFVRQGVAETGSTSPALTAQGFSDPLGFTRGGGRRVPTEELRDDITWAHKTHTIQAGVDVQLPRNHFVTNQTSSPTYYLDDSGYCINNCSDSLDALQSYFGGVSYAPSSINSFKTSYLQLLGSIIYAGATQYANPKTGVLTSPQGQPVARNYAEDDWEVYLQDSWRVRSNMTLNVGVRYSYFGVPWEQNGLQTIPTMPLDQWFAQRVSDMNNGISASASPLIGFTPGGKANGKASWYSPTRNNFAPRIGIAYSPAFDSGIGKKIFGGPGKASVRAGFGIFYQRVGGAIAVDEATNGGDTGLTNSLITPLDQFSMATAPRFAGTCTGSAGCTGLPSFATMFPGSPTSVTFPFVPPSNLFNVNFAVDDRLRTPYAYDFHVGVERAVGKGVTVGVAYVGNMGRRLLLKKDYGQYYGYFKDKTSGQTLWQAYNLVVDQMGPNPATPTTPVASITPVAFFTNLMPNLPQVVAKMQGNPAIASMTPTQAFYEEISTWTPDWSDALLALDSNAASYGSPWASSVDPNGAGGVLFGPQYITLPSWTAQGSSVFNSLQLTVREKVGLLSFDANYVFGKSIDNGSASENADLFLTEGQVNGQIPNAFNINAARARSDFDLRHNFNADWVLEAPFGQGKRFGAQAGKFANAVISNWRLTGTLRWRSGFPLTPGNGYGYATNEWQAGAATIIGNLHTSVTKKDPNGYPNLFSNPTQAYQDVVYTRPGYPGSRNVVTGPAYFASDLGLSKSFEMPWNEHHLLQFRVEAFNVFNDVNFGSTPGQFSTVYPGLQNPTEAFNLTVSANQFGRMYTTAGPRGGAREMQVAVRYDF